MELRHGDNLKILTTGYADTLEKAVTITMRKHERGNDIQAASPRESLGFAKLSVNARAVQVPDHT